MIQESKTQNQLDLGSKSLEPSGAYCQTDSHKIGDLGPLTY